MKKAILVILILSVALGSLVGCGKDEDFSKHPFVEVKWSRTTDSDIEYIFFGNKGEFSYYCACGNPVNDSDLCEGFSYDEDTKTITLNYIEETSESVTEVVVKKCSADELVLDFDGDIRTFFKETEEETNKPTSDTLTYKGNTYELLEFNADIFYYDLNRGVDYEEDTICPLNGTDWDIVYCNGDLFVRSFEQKMASSYYANDSNYTWSVSVDEENLDKMQTYPLNLSKEEINSVYNVGNLPQEEVLFFDDIEKFAVLTKTSKDDFISANIQLAFYKNTWYWRSEIIEEEIEGWPEYVYKLPKTLNDKINKMVG